MCGRNVGDRPLRARVVVALGKGGSAGVRAGRGAAAALQTQQEAQSQTQNQRDHQVALTVRYLQRKGSTVKVHIHIMSFPTLNEKAWIKYYICWLLQQHSLSYRCSSLSHYQLVSY